MKKKMIRSERTKRIVSIYNANREPVARSGTAAAYTSTYN